MKRHATYCWSVCAGWLAVIAPAAAASGVRDDAHLYKPATIARAEQGIAAIRRQHSVEVFIETFAGIPADRLAEFKSLKGNAQQEFVTRWAAERAEKLAVDGIYVLICKNPPHTRVVVEQAHAEEFGDRERTKLFKLLASRGWWKSADQGLVAGVDYVRDRLDAHARGESTAGVEWSAILWLMGGLLGLWIVIGVARALSGAGRYACDPGRGTPTEGGALAGVFGGMFGAMAGHWLYESFFGGPATGETAPTSEPSEPIAEVGERDDEFTDGFDDVEGPAVQEVAEDYSNGGDF